MKNKIFIISFLYLLIFSGCKEKFAKQYPEDIVRTKLTPTERLVGKWWTLSKATYNGIDYTDRVYDLIGEYKFYLTSTEHDPKGFEGTSYSDREGGYAISWLFYNKENDISFRRTAESIFYPTVIIAPTYFYVFPNSGFSLQYTHILKLTVNELKIKRESKSGDSVIVNEFVN